MCWWWWRGVASAEHHQKAPHQHHTTSNTPPPPQKNKKKPNNNQRTNNKTNTLSGTDRSDIVGLILIKELLRFFRTDATPAVGDLRMRVLPRMPYDTAMFDMLNFFQTGRSHMVRWCCGWLLCVCAGGGVLVSVCVCVCVCVVGLCVRVCLWIFVWDDSKSVCVLSCLVVCCVVLCLLRRRQTTGA